MRKPQSVSVGPVEGMILVDGRPQMERMDMPCISFESILAMQRAVEVGKEEHDREGEQ